MVLLSASREWYFCQKESFSSLLGLFLCNFNCIQCISKTSFTQLLMEKTPARAKSIVPEQTNIMVAIRVRPLSLKQESQGEFDIVRVQDNLIVADSPDHPRSSQNRRMLEVLHRSKQQHYTFDKVFREHSHDQIFALTCRPLVRTALNGCNATVFAYGPTGTGKTYTMLGSQQVPGLSVLTVREMFQVISRDYENNYDILITYVEIYNESIRDLLVQVNNYLQLRDDPDKGIIIANVTEVRVDSTDQVMNLLFAGNRRRTTQATNANLTSSRSHAVFQISINKRPKARGPQFESHLGKLSLIDLAGSERGTVTQNRGIRLMQGAKINRSLLALANCINALGDKSKKGYFVPYRDSKLTRLLKDSLGGNCRTVMIANVSPASSQFEETINSLKYANRAKNIKTKQVPNKKLVHLHISEYKNIINDLRNEIESLKMRLHQRVIQTSEVSQQSKSYKRDSCMCGRGDDIEEMKRIQNTIRQNFQDRIQLRRALMELQEQNAVNMHQIRTKAAMVQGWRKANPQLPLSEEMQSLLSSMQLLKSSTLKNRQKKQVMQQQLQQNIIGTKRIRDEIPKKIKFKDKRDFLQLQIKNHILELQNIQLQINIEIQDKSIHDLKTIINSQRAILQQAGLQLKDDFQLPQDPDQLPLETEDDDVQVDTDQEQDDDIQQRMDLAFQPPQTRVWVRQRSANNLSKKQQQYVEQEKKTKRIDALVSKEREFSINGQQLIKPRLKQPLKQPPKDREREARERKQRQRERQAGGLELNLRGVGLSQRGRDKSKKK